VLIDVAMPIMDGPMLITQLRQQTPELKVIYTAGYAEDTSCNKLA
jgi:CheY-like chemotaxis protein